MDARRVGRRAVVAWVGAALAAAGPLGRAALADAAIDKDKFKEGCQSGGNSYIDNPDGSFQCNLKDSGEIKCPSTTGQCIYVPPRKVAVVNGGLFGVVGQFELVENGAVVSDPRLPVGSVMEAPELGITLVVADPKKRRRGKHRR